MDRPAPTLNASSRVTDAPGEGILPLISAHLGATPMLYRLSDQPVEDVSPLMSRQYLHGAQGTFSRWIMKAGAVVPAHHHPSEQITWITEGACDVYSQGKKYTMRAGDIMIIPPNVPHAFHFTEDTTDIDMFAPARQDWIDGTTGYYPKK
jgi:quercetin dioxygenase-like cupin family protein